MNSVAECLSKDNFVALCGIQLVSVAPGFARAKLALEERHWNSIGIVQGGAIFTLADYAFAAASNSHGTVAVGVNVSISYVKAVKSGTLWAEARELSKTRKLGTYTVEVKDDAGELVAIFQGLVYRKDEQLPGLTS